MSEALEMWRSAVLAPDGTLPTLWHMPWHPLHPAPCSPSPRFTFTRESERAVPVCAYLHMQASRAAGRRERRLNQTLAPASGAASTESIDPVADVIEYLPPPRPR